MSRHTPTPWKADPGVRGGLIDDHLVYITIRGQGRSVSSVSCYGRKADGSHAGRPLKYSGGHSRSVPESECRANADFIVRACNAHEELLDAATMLVARTPNVIPGDMIFRAVKALRAAIAKAEGRDDTP